MQLNRPKSALVSSFNPSISPETTARTGSFSSQFKTMRFSYHISRSMARPQPPLRRIRPSSSSPRLMTKSLSLEPGAHGACLGAHDDDSDTQTETPRLSSDPGPQTSGPLGLQIPGALLHPTGHGCNRGDNESGTPQEVPYTALKTRPPLPGPKPQVPPKPPHLQQSAGAARPRPRAPDKPLPLPPPCRPLPADPRGGGASQPPTLPRGEGSSSPTACVLSLIEKFERRSFVVPDITGGGLCTPWVLETGPGGDPFLSPSLRAPSGLSPVAWPPGSSQDLQELQDLPQVAAVLVNVLPGETEGPEDDNVTRTLCSITDKRLSMESGYSARRDSRTPWRLREQPQTDGKLANRDSGIDSISSPSHSEECVRRRRGPGHLPV
ncbi:FYVE, RhoGEF and PH domain-containing protein 1-like [Salmo trutta]|uniref:FYVE, RhoGEF and PH domain-containing protein 1-like n=1 Tax=Salmo trutta TaxID=8032 RepID=UPI001130A671|nr:FYVE, RhoGEF and PH domain-containing protein 1-like [Salmo trutta]